MHGEYLLLLCADFEIYHDTLEPHFDLQLATPGEIDVKPWHFNEFNNQETIFTATERSETLVPGTLKCQRHLLNTLDVKLVEEIGKHHSYLTSELHPQRARGRVIWEVYSGKGRLSEIAEVHEGHCQDLFPGNWMGPTEQRRQLVEHREWHHATHLKFNRKIYLQQVQQGGHCHLEQPAYALSWKTKALFDLPGYRAQRMWTPVKKPTGIQTTKRILWQELQKLCDGSHQHCRLEGSSPGTGRRTQFMENYQPTMAGILAACLMADETTTAWEFAGAVDDEREQLGGLVKLMTENRQEAVKTVQRLHRGLGHPTPEALTDMLESRGASDMIIKCAREYKCVACARYKKPDGVAPSSLPKAEFNERLQADVLWLKIDSKKVPTLSLVDEATKYQAASVVHSEKAEHFQHAIERLWIRNFGCPKTLITDEAEDGALMERHIHGWH
eukprot:s421_g44.t1